MKITKGTPKAMAFLDLLKQEGCLVDVYSEDFFDRQPAYSENPYAPFFKSGLARVNQLEADPKEKIKPKNHLLFIYLDPYKRELTDQLLSVYPLLKMKFEAFHKPDFLILNLFTKQMLCIGFGRKNQLFAYDPAYEFSIDFFGYTGMGDGGKYIKRFIEHDSHDLVEDFAHALGQLSVAMFDWDHLPHNDEAIGITLDEGPKDDGLFHIDDEEEGYTKEEMEDFLERFADCQGRGDEALIVINSFFPQCEWGELNTGDY